MTQRRILEELLLAHRQVNYFWHVQQALLWLQFDKGRQLDSVLVYAALELRCAVERYFFEVLYMLKDGGVSADDERRCRSLKGLQALLREHDPHYRKTVRFSKLWADVMPGVPKITEVDLGQLARAWQSLSEFCHWQARPADSFESHGRAFQEQGFRCLRETLDLFVQGSDDEVSTGLVLRGTLREDARAIYDDFLAGRIDDEQVSDRLRSLL